jgi:hypothetical protein
MIKNIALLLACASLGVGTAANARTGENASDGWTSKFCIKYVNGLPVYVPCKK